jgi:hypothetical protein
LRRSFARAFEGKIIFLITTHNVSLVTSLLKIAHDELRLSPSTNTHTCSTPFWISRTA